MKLLQVAEQNKKYYTKDFILGFNTGAKAQLEADKRDAERRGMWVDIEPAPHNLLYATCSVCGERQTIEVANYCPMCGASMDEVTE